MLKPISEIAPYVPFGKSKVTQTLKEMAKKGVVDLPTGVILVVTFAAVAFFGVSPVLMVVIATAAGILINVVRGRRA